MVLLLQLYQKLYIYGKQSLQCVIVNINFPVKDEVILVPFLTGVISQYLLILKNSVKIRVKWPAINACWRETGEDGSKLFWFEIEELPSISTAAK